MMSFVSALTDSRYIRLYLKREEEREEREEERGEEVVEEAWASVRRWARGVGPRRVGDAHCSCFFPVYSHILSRYS